MDKCATTPNETPPNGLPVTEVINRLKSVRLRPESPSPKASEAAIARIAEMRGTRYHPSRCRLDLYRVYDAEQGKALEAVTAYAARVTEAVSAGEGLVLYGPCGTGKDHLLGAVLYGAVRAGMSGAWINGQEMFGGFRDRIRSETVDEVFFRKMCEPAVLLISDPIPPAGQPSAFDLSNLYRLLERRYSNMQPTWASINALSRDDAMNKLSVPVWDRLQHRSAMVPCFWPSYRERK